MKFAVVFLFIFLSAFNAKPQTATYSRDLIVSKNSDNLQLVADIGNHHQLLVISPERKIVIHIFNKTLEAVSRVEVPIKIPTSAGFNFHKTKDEYFLSTTTHNRLTGMWKIDAKGKTTDLLDAYTKLLDSTFPKSNGFIKMEIINNKIYFLSNLIFRELKKIVTTIAQVDSNLKLVESKMVSYSTGQVSERITSITLMDAHNLLILKTSVDTGRNQLLKLVKLNVDELHETIATFNTGHLSLSNPKTYTTLADTTIIVYSAIGPISSRQPSAFFASVNKSFTNVSLPKVQRLQPVDNFLLVQEPFGKWFSFLSPFKRPVVTLLRGDQQLEQIIRAPVPGEISTSPKFGQFPNYYTTNIDDPTPINLLALSTNFKLSADSLIKNNEKNHSVAAQGFKDFRFNNNGYLLLNQLFKKAKGLVLMYATAAGKIQSTNILVNTKYEYHISQAASINNNSILVPFRHRQEAGLLKIAIDEYLR